MPALLIRCNPNFRRPAGKTRSILVCQGLRAFPAATKGRKMSESLTKRPLIRLLLVVCLLAALATALTGSAADPRDVQRRKAEVEQKVSEQKRKFEQTQREIKATHERALTDFAKARSSGSTLPEAPAFDAASAPPPEECFWAFVTAAKNANSMEQVLPYLPDRQQRTLKARQLGYDPKQAAKNVESLRQRNSKLTEENLTHLSSSPFTFMLKWHKGVANSIINVLSVKTEGNKATLIVSTNRSTTINGEYYGYGTADVEMVGEGSSWRLASFKSSIIVYKEAP
jgi:cell division protein FtsB